MLRMFVCATLALLFAASINLAADKGNKKKGNAVVGKVKQIDAAAGKLTVTVTKKKVSDDVDFTVGETVKVVSYTGADKTELTGKDGLKSVKVGDKVHVLTDGTNNVVSIQVGDAPKKKKKDKTAQ